MVELLAELFVDNGWATQFTDTSEALMYFQEKGFGSMNRSGRNVVTLAKKLEMEKPGRMEKALASVEISEILDAEKKKEKEGV